jgi:hypothetical protein
MHDRLTPSRAIMERNGLIKILDTPGAIDLIPALRNCPNMPEVEQVIINARLTIPDSEIVIWEPEMYWASVAGCEVFMGNPAPESFFYAPSQVWFMSRDFAPSDEINRLWGLDGEWVIAAILLRRFKMNTFSMESLASPGLSSLQREHLLKMNDHAGKMCTILTVLFSRTDDYIHKHRNDLINENLFCIVPVGLAVEGEPVILPILCGFIANHLFMNSTIAEAKAFDLNHQARKEAKKAGYPPPTVRAVILRRKQSSKEASDMHSEVEWSCQWFVKGHWRKLHEPRKLDGAMFTYIQPHIKGPQDKPLKAPTEAIYIVKE